MWKVFSTLFIVAVVIVFFLTRQTSPYSKERLRNHIKILASQEFGGRGPLTDGETKTIAYITEQFHQAKLQPLTAWGHFEQNVPLASISSRPTSRIQFGSITLEEGKDIAIKSSDTSKNIDFTNVEVVFVNYGISSVEWKWDDYVDIDVKGKVVIALVGDPGFYKADLFQGKDMTYFGRWKYKFEEAVRHGALGAFVIHDDKAAGYGWSVAAANDRHAIIDEPVKPGDNPPLKVHGWLTQEAARKIFTASQKDYDAIIQQATEQPKPGIVASLPNSSLSVLFENSVSTGSSKNLCGILPGKMFPDEYVMISAHWDHLGKRSVDGNDAIFAGAIDNASGVSAMLELARYFNKRPALERSIIFCSFTAEEQGLLGAKYFVGHPPFDLAQLKGVINLDSLNMGAKNPRVIHYGRHEGMLEPLLKSSAQKLGREVIADPHGERGYFFRSDHYPFVAQKVPSLLFLDIGFSNPDYLAHHYHQPTDVYDASWPLEGLLNDMDLFVALTTTLAKKSDVKN